MQPPEIPPPPPSLRDLIARNDENEVTYSDTGNAKRLVALYGARMAFEPETRRWYYWEGTHWEPDVEGVIFQLTEQVVAQMRDESLTLPDEPANGMPSPRQRLQQHALRTEAEGARRRMVSVAESDQRVVVRQERLNRALNLLACPNGTVDLDTGDLITSDPAHMSTACCRVPYDPNARSAELDTYLRTFMPDEEDQQILFGILGTALRGGNAARLLPLLLGPSTSGKSQLVAAVANLLQGYAAAVNVGVFRGSLDDRPRPDLVKAMHVRLAYASEAARSWELHADQVKRLTGGDKITYRNLYAQTVESEPLFTPFIIANEMPRVKGADEAFKRRMIVIRFGISLLGGLEDTRVRQRFIHDERCLAALLAKMVEGARSDLFAHGVDWAKLPNRFALALADAFDEVDHVGSFLLWMTEAGHLVKLDAEVPASHCAKASELHGWYTYWVRKHGDRSDREGQLSMRDFGGSLRARGWETRTAMGVRWIGWGLVPAAAGVSGWL